MKKKGNDTEKEIKKIAHVLLDGLPTTTKQGRREYARLMRKIEKAKPNKNIPLGFKWEKLKKDFVDFLNVELSELV